MDSRRLRKLAQVPGPFVSLVIDDSRDTHDADKQAAARWTTVRRTLEQQGAAEKMISTLEHAVLHGHPGVGREGRAIIVGAEGVLIDELLDTAPSTTQLRVSEYPYVLPLLGHGTFRPNYVFAGVDHLGADITWHHDGTVEHETIEGAGFPVHKPATAGWQGYGDVSHSAEEAVRMNMRAIADRLTEVIDRIGAEAVFVCAEIRARADLVSALPERIGERVIPLTPRASGTRTTEHDVATLVDDEFERRRIEAINMALARFDTEEGRHSGLAVKGLEAVCAALRDGAVDTLIIGDLGGITVVAGEDRTLIAPNADVLSELGEAARHVAPADEALPFAALATDAWVVRLPGDTALGDGAAALLRYAPAGNAQVDEPGHRPTPHPA